MDTSPDPSDTAPDHNPDLSALIESLTDQEYAVTRRGPHVLDVVGRFSNTERVSLTAAAGAGRTPVAIWATNHHEDWTLVAWDRPELVTIVRRGPAPPRWRHRRLPPAMSPDAQTFLEGSSSPFDIVTRPKHQPTDAAREVLGRFGITDPAPPDWIAPPVAPPVVQEVSLPTTPARRTPGTARVAKPKPAVRPSKPEPTIAVCPTCFMALPATGVCDNCG